MGFYEQRVLPRCVDFALSTRPIMKARKRVVQGLHGVVVEIGFGSGLNVPLYPSEVTKVIAIDPSQGGRRLAAQRLRACATPIEWGGLDGQVLALPDASVDCALSTYSLCTIPSSQAALHELHRVLKPGGSLHFLEHGRSPQPRVAKWQDRLTPLQRRLAGGCRLNRSIDVELREAGFCIDKLDNYYLEGPRVMTYMFEGRARACTHAPRPVEA